MTSTDELLSQLGLTGMPLETIAKLDWPDDEVGRGLDTRQLAAGLIFLQLGVSPHLIGGRLSGLEENQRIVRYEPQQPATISRVLLAEPDRRALLELTATRATVDLTRSSGFAVELVDGRIFIFEVTGEIKELRLPVKALVQVPPFSIEAVKRANDSWIEERVTFHLKVDDSWHNAVAAGLFLRLVQIPKAAQLPKFASDSPSHAWVSRLTTEQLETIAARTDARLDALWSDLDRLDFRLEAPGADWVEDLHRLCRDRDDLEGVRLLLNWTKTNDRLEERILGLDATAEAALQNLPMSIKITDEQLYRAAVVSPISWWTIPVRFDDDDRFD